MLVTCLSIRGHSPRADLRVKSEVQVECEDKEHLHKSKAHKPTQRAKSEAAMTGQSPRSASSPGALAREGSVSGARKGPCLPALAGLEPLGNVRSPLSKAALLRLPVSVNLQTNKRPNERTNKQTTKQTKGRVPEAVRFGLRHVL